MIYQIISQFKKIEPFEIEKLLNDPNEILIEKNGIVCRIRGGAKRSQVVWLAPHNKPMLDLYEVLSLALLETYKRFPNSIIWARYRDGAGCLKVFGKTSPIENIIKTWLDIFPSSQYSYHWWIGSWFLFGKLNEIVNDILIQRTHHVSQTSHRQ